MHRIDQYVHPKMQYGIALGHEVYAVQTYWANIFLQIRFRTDRLPVPVQKQASGFKSRLQDF